MLLIIPMVGESIRFKKAGFETPKFLLKINNKLVIEHVIDLFPGEKNFLFICNKKHLSNKRIKLASILKRKCPTGKIISINFFLTQQSFKLEIRFEAFQLNH